MEEKCTICSNGCSRDNLQCGRGHRLFNGEDKGKQTHGHHEYMKANDLTSQLMKCGHILMHKTGKNRGQEKILKILNEKESMSQKALQEVLNIEAGSLSEILMKLEHHGFITKEKDQNDRRKAIVTISEKGKILMSQQDQDEDFFKMLNEDEKKQLQLLMKKILSTWHQEHHGHHRKKG